MIAPPPMVPIDADLQDFAFMPLQVARLRDSDLAAEVAPEACWYAVLLWSASWHQLPAGSLPNNEAVLCKLIGLGRDTKTFRRYRAGAMRGWIECDDGRLYHPVVAEQVRAAWHGKLRQRHLTLCAAVRKSNERNPSGKRDAPNFETWLSLGRPSDMASLVTPLSRVTGGNKKCDAHPLSQVSHAKDRSKRQRQRQRQRDTEEESLPSARPLGGTATRRHARDAADGGEVA